MNNGIFGENFPYSNFHDLNLDWIISIVKDFKEQYPQVISEINNKLNKPIFNPDGNLNNVLMSNGDGTTKWGTLGVEFYPEILQAVSEWLEDHPEATTTVQDSSLTLAKFTDYLKYLTIRNQSGCITPVYIGDYLVNTNYLPSAVYVNDKNVIVVDAPTRSYGETQQNGNGNISIYNLTDNERKTFIQAKVGHGNSIAFDGTYYYISPIWEYDSQGETRISKVYKYNTSFVLLEEINTPQPITGVSFDSVTNNLYAVSGAHIYKYENGIFGLYSTISNWSEVQENIIDSDRYYNQDLAVYNNEFYISSPYGNIVHGYMQEETAEITDSYYVNYFDSTGRFTMGELEGFEFTGKHLYAIMYTNLPSDMRNAFVVELPVNKSAQSSPTMLGVFTSANGTLTLSEATQNRFYLNAYQIRSLQQLHCRRCVDNFTAVEIPANNNVSDDFVVRISEPITILLSGHYSCRQISVHKGSLNIEATGSNNLLSISNTNYLISLTRSAQLMLTGANTLNIDAPNITTNQNSNFVGFGNNKAIIIQKCEVAETHNKILKIGTNNPIANELFVGSERTLNSDDEFKIAGWGGCTWNSGKTLYLYATYGKKLPTNFTVAGNLKPLGANGLVGDSAGISLTNTTTYNFSWTHEDDFNISVTITRKDGNAFANAVDQSNIFCANVVTFTRT